MKLIDEGSLEVIATRKKILICGVSIVFSVVVRGRINFK